MTETHPQPRHSFGVFVAASWMHILYAFASFLYIILNGSSIFVLGIQSIFRRIPFIGGLFFSYIQSAGSVDFKTLYQKVAMPALALSVVAYLLYTLILQGILIYFLKVNEKGNLSYLKLTMIPLLLVTNLVFMSMHQIVARGFSSKVDFMFLWITWVGTIIQGIAYVLWMKTAFDEKRINTHEMRATITKQSTLNRFKFALVISMLLATTTFAVVNHTVNDLKVTYKLETVIDLKPAANDTIEVIVPKEVHTLSQTLGIKIPQYIKGGAILKSLGLDTLEVGSIVNRQINNLIMIYQQQWLETPMQVGVVCTVLLLLGTVLEWLKHKLHAYRFGLQLGITGLTLVLLFAIGKRFTLIPFLFALFLCLAETVKLWQYPPFQSFNKHLKYWLEKRKPYEK